MSNGSVPDRRIRVWVQAFPDRTTLQLQWHDPETGRRRTRSSGTADPALAEDARSDLECRLTDGTHVQPTRVGWARFRELYERDYLSGWRQNTRLNHRATLDLLERLCRPATPASVDSRMLGTFVGLLRREPHRKGP